MLDLLGNYRYLPKKMKSQNIFHVNTLSEKDVFMKIINPKRQIAKKVANDTEYCLKMRSSVSSEIPT